MTRLLLVATLLGALLAAPPAAAAQPRGGGGDDAERAFVESLRGRDPAGAERYVALRDAREQAIAELRRVEAQYAAAGSELRPVFLSPLRRRVGRTRRGPSPCSTSSTRTTVRRSPSIRRRSAGSTPCSRRAARRPPGSRSS